MRVGSSSGVVPAPPAPSSSAGSSVSGDLDPLESLLQKLGLEPVGGRAADGRRAADETTICNCGIDGEECTLLMADLVRHAPVRVQYLFFGGAACGDAGALAIADAMTRGAMPDLMAIDLSSNRATDVGFSAVVGSIAHCSRFRDLVFARNTLGDAGFAALTEVLLRDEWPGVERLDLSGAEVERHTISDGAFLAFAAGLADGQLKAIRLEVLGMSHCDVGDAGLQALCLAVKRGSLRRLKSLHLVSNHVSDEGAYDGPHSLFLIAPPSGDSASLC
jgi:hypothetical protein